MDPTVINMIMRRGNTVDIKTWPKSNQDSQSSVINYIKRLFAK